MLCLCDKMLHNNPLHLHWVGRRGLVKKETKKRREMSILMMCFPFVPRFRCNSWPWYSASYQDSIRRSQDAVLWQRFGWIPCLRSAARFRCEVTIPPIHSGETVQWILNRGHRETQHTWRRFPVLSGEPPRDCSPAGGSDISRGPLPARQC